MIQIDKVNHSNKLLSHLHIHSDVISARIYPNLGGSIQELVFDKVRIIDGISNEEAGLKDYGISYKSAILFPFPNRIEDGAYEFLGSKHQFPINEPSVNNAIHGLVYNKEFEVSSIHSEKSVASVTLIYRSDGSTPGFPFPFDLKLTYTLNALGSLQLDFDLLNSGLTGFPYGFGWHPYFFSEELEKNALSFRSKDFFACDKRSIPSDTLDSPLAPSFNLEGKIFDDAYSLHKSHCGFESTSYKLQLRFGYKDDTYLQIYTPPHRKSIALEPMTCVANAFNNKTGLKKLAPGQKDTWAISLEVEIRS